MKGVVKGCIGSLDGISIKTYKPNRKYGPKGYYCRKKFYSINVQAMCDSKRRFTFVSVKAVDSIHDSTAFGLSWLGKLINQRDYRWLGKFW